MEGSVYTISPRLIVPRDTVAMPKDITRRFWLTVRCARTTRRRACTAASVQIEPQRGASIALPLEFTVRQGTLDPVDVPAGPWGHTINLPWYDDEVAAVERCDGRQIVAQAAANTVSRPAAVCR